MIHLGSLVFRVNHLILLRFRTLDLPTFHLTTFALPLSKQVKFWPAKRMRQLCAVVPKFSIADVAIVFMRFHCVFLDVYV